MKSPDYRQFFQSYVAFFNDALAREPVIDDLRECYAEFLVSASAGKVMGGENGADYAKTLDQGFDFYRAVGVTAMRLRKVETSEIIPDHDQARVFFTAEMKKKDGSPVSIDFDVIYFLQRRDSGPKIFAFVSEDEMAIFRELGLVDAEGKPV